jgi:tetratricopeptide (TPR) repeat protein
MRRFLLFTFLSFLALTARAQTAHWEGSDDSSELQLIFEECAPDGDPKLPPLEDTVLTLTGNSSQTSIINGSFSRSTILTYNSRARRAGVTVQIPAFTVETNKGPVKVPAFTGGAPRVIPDSTVNARLMTGSTMLWAGEVFPVTYILDAARRNFSQLGSNVDWNTSPLIAEDWSKPEPTEMSLNGEARINISYHTRAYAKTPGTLLLNPATQLVRIITGNVGFGFFQQQRVEELTVSTKRPELIIRPLPTPNVAGFTGAVGDFKLVSKVVPNTAAVGEPITWTLELSGSGNWPDIAGLPQREVSKDFQVVQPKAKRTPAEGKLFDATLSEDVVLVPTRPGMYTLGPVYFTYFDPKSGSYQTLSTPRTTVTITAAAPVNPGVQLPKIAGANPPTSPAETAPPAAAPEVPAAPTAIPRDPLTDLGRATLPRPGNELLLLLLAPFALLLLFWFWLSLGRARETDPVRFRRAARARLAATLAKFPTASPAERPALLLAWQHDTALLWEILHAAPPATSLHDAAWSTLWAESDRALYGANPLELPADWIPRAEAALAAKSVPRFSPFSAFLPRNLIPVIALLALTATLLVPSLRAEDGTAAYRRGDFPAAEKAWREAVAQNATDPAARYNLSLALAQQDRWDLAMAHATAAFVQAPHDERIRWQFALAAEKSGYVPEALAAFPHPAPLQSLARLASSGGWQIWLLVAAVLVGVALSLLLFGAYRTRSRLRTAGAQVLLVVGLLLATTSVLGYRAYGETADARAVIVWHATQLRSIPTEADTTQKTSPLAPGSIAVIDQTFLGWVRLAFANGQTGWVRQDDVVALWR